MLKKIILFVSLLFCSLTVVANDGYDFEAMRERVIKDIHKQSDGTAGQWVGSQRKDGSWKDLSYGEETTASTRKNHMLRLYQIAQSCTEEGKPNFNDAGYVKALKKGLVYWSENKAVDQNWWFNEIYYPQKLGEVMLMMRQLDDKLPLTSENGLSESQLMELFLPQGKEMIVSHNTGANATDISLHYVYRALLTNDAQVLEDVVAVLEPVLVDNIKEDCSYQDHGPQLQIASYGIVYCSGLIKLSYYLAGTPAEFDITSPNYSRFLTFIKEVQIPSIRGAYWDYSCLGRGVSRPNATKGKLSYLSILASHVDTANADLYNDALARHSSKEPATYNVSDFNKHYWVADYTQHAREEYLFTIRNASARTAECESGNDENLKGQYLSYGATSIMVFGDEYANIMPLWDWKMIPGTTVSYAQKLVGREEWGKELGTTHFVGGVSNGEFGNAVLTVDKYGIKAQKSWFFFDDEIVCLGAGISGNKARTTINQCFSKGPVMYVRTPDTEVQYVNITDNERSIDQLQVLSQGGVSYYFPEEMNVKFTLGKQEGDWYSINNGYSADAIRKNVFTMWVEHKGVSSDKYAYVVLPKAAITANYISPLDILSNTDQLQAVLHNELGLLQAVFYTAGEVVHDFATITVDQPCTLLFDGTSLTVADPTQLLNDITITITIGEETITQKISLPKDLKSGAPVTSAFF